ncbi:PP2C family protein-serine/threonine phosphatase [Actinocrinis sp.]|uniref:PP2C family protein-serine/threonine phosphatase n=1 Tax=Actinocrinis sp. TaxID=1920516 RepID=UPI002C2B2EB0|nr:PP2C family protein-serine/threonine phosphatase [Actinocrinis sp.]HXR72581.1 PP2C family protein-serine/threonine phosphatase [Actinocrinis sp.]
MDELSAVIVTADAQRSRAVADLAGALRADGIQFRHVSEHSALDPLTGPEAPDLALLPASLGAQRVRRLCALAARASRPPAIMVYLDGTLAALEECVGAGLHYLVPPFRGPLIRAQLVCTAERRAMAATLVRMEHDAQLRELERELSIAREIQAGFLPASLPAAAGWDLAVRFRPARHVAGDFYDAFSADQGRRVFLAIADVCDKGVGAALFTALVRTLLRHVSQPGLLCAVPEDSSTMETVSDPVTHAIASTNAYMARHHRHQGYFATVFFGMLELESGELTYVNGGHNPPVLRRRGGALEHLSLTGPAVGLDPDGSYRPATVRLERGDSLLLFTDGVTEARDAAGRFFGERRLLAQLLPPVTDSAALLDRIEARVQKHTGVADQSDDITLFAVRRED